ncbi:hypothetical protein [Kitasatospora mediocidica]|uniref:hypothetical protein n=1 Tax=Kitasatospora mediocidica TaxID=58352 RepID=UPI00056A6374|nr:hypothetical protein [Kitasatospora mediocidica]
MNTATTGPSSPRGLRLALALYPAAYRAERGAEIAAVHADSTAGAGPLTVARETLGVAAYGLRVRTGLTPGRTAGALLAAVAPLAVAAGAGQALPTLFWFAQHWGSGQGGLGDRGSLRELSVASGITAVLWLMVAAAALVGRWTAARILTVLAAVGALSQWLVFQYRVLDGDFGRSMPLDLHSLIAMAGPPVLWALLVIAAPRELLDTPSAHRPQELVAPLLVTTAFALLHSELSDQSVLLLQQLIWPIALPLFLLALLALRWGRLLPAAVGLTALPAALLLGVTSTRLSWMRSGMGPLGGFVGAALLAVLVLAVTVRFLPQTPEGSARLGGVGTE